MERILDAHVRLQSAQSVLSRRPWLPWMVPVVFAFPRFFTNATKNLRRLYAISRRFCRLLVSAGSLLPCGANVIVAMSLLLCTLVLPLYRLAHVPTVALAGILLCLLLTMRQVMVCVDRVTSSYVSTPLVLLDAGYSGIMVYRWFLFVCAAQPPAGRQLRQWIWVAITQHLPLILIPQMMLLVILMES